MNRISRISYRQFHGDPDNFSLEWNRLKNSSVEKVIIYYKDKPFPYLITPKMKVFGQKIVKNPITWHPSKAYRLIPLLDPKSRFYIELKKMDDIMMASFDDYR